ncbi:MAG: glycoside hydrolase family 38 C-terminal domain-containing protein, partial [Fimbriimonas sp.]|nr:glycoside hydrolase family 38 C-terminal domain-containing protein [Fimbriimonas sp.]
MFFNALVLLTASMTATTDGPVAGHLPGKQTLYYIPHTHWEGAVFYTREEYLQFGLSNILSALRLLEKYPEYTFVLDQVAYFKPFLERYPEQAAAFRRFIKEGRLQIVGGQDVMPDDVKPGGELFVRQIQYGKQYCREKLGIDVTVAWLLDTFGHHPQMPQILKQAGFKSFWFCRGVPNDDLPSEFNWKGLDGSTIPAVWLPGFYGLFYGPPRDQAGFDRFFVDRFNALDKHTHYPERVGLAGVDVSEPEDYVTPLARAFNAEEDKKFTIRYSVPTQFADLVAKRTDTPTLSGDFNPIFQGTYSSRIELKQATREIEGKLLDAEKLTSLASLFGDKPDPEMLWQAWEPLLFNQTHDLASGTMADHVYRDTVQSNEYSKRLAEEMIEHRWSTVAAHIDTRGVGNPILVFNSLGQPRSEVVEADLGSIAPNVRSIHIVDSAGKEIPAQLASTEAYGDGSLRRAKIDFLAKNIPALGYATFRAVPDSVASETPSTSSANPTKDVLENEFFTVTVNLKSGEIDSIVDKATGQNVLSGPANVVSRQDDKGDLWEMYHTLDGGMYIGATDKQPVPNSTNALLSNAFADKPGSVVHGATFSEFHVSHPFGSGSFETRIRVSKGVRRIDIETTLVNNEKQVRYQVLVPTAIRGGRYVQEIPFGAVQRPIGVEYPAQTWVDYGNDRYGVALLNNGMPGNLVNDGTLMLSLLRSQSLGDYNLGHTSDSGFELGEPRTFRYSIVPHTGDWTQAGVVQEGQSFNNPLLVRKAE